MFSWKKCLFKSLSIKTDLTLNCVCVNICLSMRTDTHKYWCLEARRGHLMPWGWNYSGLKPPQVLGEKKLTSSSRVTRILYFWDISLAFPVFCLFFCWVLGLSHIFGGLTTHQYWNKDMSIIYISIYLSLYIYMPTDITKTSEYMLHPYTTDLWQECQEYMTPNNIEKTGNARAKE